MPVVVRAEGRGEEYVVSVPAYACKDELKQVVEDEMLIHNRNFVQLAELVCLQLLCTILEISKLWPYSNAFFCKPLHLFEI